MSDTPDFGFGKFMPGFEFLQKLAQGATQGMPQIGNWVAPTLSVEELDKRISELKTVQFWLDQNAVGLKATIQALEVQKMTLSTLKNMNFSMGDLAEAFKIKVPETAAPAAAAPAPTAAPAPQPAPEAAAAPAGVVDPMQWWGALTQQFQQIAASAMKEAASHPAMETTQTMAQEALKTATDVATSMTRAAVETVNAAQSAAQSAAEAATEVAKEAAKTATEAATKAAAPAKKAATKTTKAASKTTSAAPASAKKTSAAAPAAAPRKTRSSKS